MALNVSTLRSRIQRVFEDNLPDKAQIARRIARAYQEYARAAQAPPGVPVVLKGTEVRVLENGILTFLNARMPAPQAAQIIGSAITAFWLLPPVQTGAGGVVTAIVTQAGVAKLISTRVKTVPAAALALSSSLDLMTRTVFVVNPPPVSPGFIF